ncbi:MAG: VTT domain-containing protein [Collinsella sp.]|nr:VTT domain-containing protein [Collinsella sp.]
MKDSAKVQRLCGCDPSRVSDTARGGGPASSSPVSDAELSRMRGRVVLVVTALAIAIALACWRYLPGVLAWLADANAVRAFVRDHGVMSRLVMVGINVVQILVAVLPGEPIELASGYAFGAVEGTILCLVASAVGSSIVFWAVRRWGWRVVGLFFDRSIMERYTWLRNTRRLELVMLAIFLVPGTPKDFLTFFAGLTPIRFASVLAICTLGRLPSIITSTAAAAAVGSGNLALALGIGGVAMLLVVAGAMVSNRLRARSGDEDA